MNPNSLYNQHIFLMLPLVDGILTVCMYAFCLQMKISVSCTALQRTLTSSLPCPARSKMAPLAPSTKETSALTECVRYGGFSEFCQLHNEAILLKWQWEINVARGSFLT